MPMTPKKRVATASSIGEPLRQAIAAAEPHIKDLARRSGVHHTVLYRFVAGERDITVAVADRLAAALGLELTVRPKGKKR